MATHHRTHRGRGSDIRNFRWEQDGVRMVRRLPKLTTLVRDAPWEDDVKQRQGNPRWWTVSDWVTGRGTLLILGGEGLARAA